MIFQRIVVPVDGSDASLKALKLAVDLQNVCGAELLILTVFRPHSGSEASMFMIHPEEPESMERILREHAKEVAEKSKKFAQDQGSQSVRAFVKNGPPARTIVAFAEKNSADLIVLGSRGTGDLEGFLLGSVSHKVTSLAECPVLVV